jgi:large repetitive protein
MALVRAMHRTLTFRFSTLGKVFLVGLWLLGMCQGVRASFTVISNGVVTQLATGSSPLGTVGGAAIDLNGNLYVCEMGNNRIIKIAPDGLTASVLSITGLSTALVSPTGLTIDAAGNLYIADTGNSRIVKVSAGAGSVISTASITLNAPQGVAIDVSGNIFVSDTGNSRIVKIPSGGTAAVFAISGLSPVLSNQKGIAVDPLGNLYIADTGNSRVVKVSSTGTAGTPLTTAAGTALDGPSGVAVGNNGVLYVADTNTTENSNPTPGRVVIVDSQGNARELLVGNPVFNSPRAVAVSAMGAVYVGDNGGTANAGRVQSFQSVTIDNSDSFTSSVGFGHVQLGSAGTSITIPLDIGTGITLSSISIYTSGTQNLDFTIANDSTCVTASMYTQNTACTVDVTFLPTTAGLRRGQLVVSYASGSLSVPIFGTADAPVSALSPSVATVVGIGSTVLSSPFQTAVDGAGNTYVTNYGANTVVKIPAGGGTGTAVSTGSFTLNQPTGVAVDASGNLFISDYGNSRIIEVSRGGTASVFAISGLSQSIDLPTALAFDGAGNLYITDYDRGRMVEVNPYGQGTVLATGTITFAMTSITGSAVDASGNVYIADRTNSRIVKVDRLGNAAPMSFTSVGALSAPEGVAVDGSGNVYVMDSSNQRIIRVTTSGATAVMPLSGVTLGSFIFGITPDALGNVLVADWSNNRLVKVNVGQSALAFANTEAGSTSSDSPKVATVTNIGDKALVFSAAPTYILNFSENSSDTDLCAHATSLAAGTSCDVSVKFTPQVAGSLSANIGVSNNTLNVSATVHNVAVSGVGIAPVQVTPTITWTPPASIFADSSLTSVLNATASNGSTTVAGTFAYAAALGSGTAKAITSATQLSVGTYALTATFTPTDTAAYHDATASATLQVQDFTLAPSTTAGSTTSASIATGGDAVYKLVFGPASGTTFPAAVTFSASGLPVGAVATFTPARIPAGSGATNVTLSIQTAATTASMTGFEFGAPSGSLLDRAIAPGALSLVMLPFIGGFRRKQRGFGLLRAGSALLLVAACVVSMAALVGCGSNKSGYFAERSQTFIVTVTATSGTLSHSTTVSLTVN